MSPSCGQNEQRKKKEEEEAANVWVPTCILLHIISIVLQDTERVVLGLIGVICRPRYFFSMRKHHIYVDMEFVHPFSEPLIQHRITANLESILGDSRQQARDMDANPS